MNNHFAWTEHPELVEFYTQHRHRPEDLYPSERRFLPWLAQQATSILDIGCAAGGFRKIWQHYNPGIQYSGIDISESLIAAARQLHPSVSFLQGDVTRDRTLNLERADVVQALGWLHWEPDYPMALQRLWSLTEHYLFFDLRLVARSEQAIVASQKLTYVDNWDGETTTPYVTVAWPEFACFLLQLQPARILGYGYWGQPAKTAIGVNSEVCFTAFVLEKSPPPASELSEVCLDSPLAWPEELRDRVQLRSSEKLADMV